MTTNRYRNELDHGRIRPPKAKQADAIRDTILDEQTRPFSDPDIVTIRKLEENLSLAVRPKTLPKRRYGRKLSMEKVQPLVDAWIDEKAKDRVPSVCAETCAEELNLQISLVRQAFTVLNHRGKLSLRHAEFAHDTNRNWMFPGPAHGWRADVFYLRNPVPSAEVKEEKPEEESAEPTADIIIVVDEGNVNAVYSSIPGLKIHVNDWDNVRAGDPEQETILDTSKMQRIY